VDGLGLGGSAAPAKRLAAGCSGVQEKSCNSLR
jgi:hypothetical protein